MNNPTPDKNAQLKPCPFCGSQPVQNAWWDWHCSNSLCSIHSAQFRTATAWNTRTAPPVSDKDAIEQRDRYIERYLAECDSHMETKSELIKAYDKIAALAPAVSGDAQNTQPLNGGIRQRVEAAASDAGNSTSRESLPNSCELCVSGEARTPTLGGERGVLLEVMKVALRALAGAPLESPSGAYLKDHEMACEGLRNQIAALSAMPQPLGEVVKGLGYLPSEMDNAIADLSALHSLGTIPAIWADIKAALAAQPTTPADELVKLAREFVESRDIHEPIADNGMVVADGYHEAFKHALGRYEAAKGGK